MLTFLQDNVLLDDNFQVQISGFGLTLATDGTCSQALHYNFVAPELFRYQATSGVPDPDGSDTEMQKSDIYAFGCLYYEACIYSYAGACAELHVTTRFIMVLCLLRMKTHIKSRSSSLEECVRAD